MARFNKAMVHINTARLELRELTGGDLAAFTAYASSPPVAHVQHSSPWTTEECQEYLAFHLTHQQEEGRTIFPLAIILPAEQRLIGICTLHIRQHDAREAELGYGLHPDYWSYGYATEAAQALLSVAFTQLHLHRVFALCDANNRASERVMQKIGMQQEGHLRENRRWRGRWYDNLLYSILEQDLN